MTIQNQCIIKVKIREGNYMKNIIFIILLFSTSIINNVSTKNIPICIYNNYGNAINQPCIPPVMPTGNIYFPN